MAIHFHPLWTPPRWWLHPPPFGFIDPVPPKMPVRRQSRPLACCPSQHWLTVIGQILATSTSTGWQETRNPVRPGLATNRCLEPVRMPQKGLVAKNTPLPVGQKGHAWLPAGHDHLVGSLEHLQTNLGNHIGSSGHQLDNHSQCLHQKVSRPAVSRSWNTTWPRSTAWGATADNTVLCVVNTCLWQYKKFRHC